MPSTWPQKHTSSLFSTRQSCQACRKVEVILWYTLRQAGSLADDTAVVGGRQSDKQTDQEVDELQFCVRIGCR